MTTFDQSDVETLEAKLLGLDLTPGEQAALTGLVELADAAAVEVTGFGDDLSGLQPGRLGFLKTMGSVGTSVRPEGIIFASAGGLGSTRIKDENIGDAK